MVVTARTVIEHELIQWLDREDYARLGIMQRLEEACHIWEYGKWCKKGGRHRLGYKGQIDYRASRSEPTAWDALRDLGDDEAMRIHAATVGLPSDALQALELAYVQWRSAEDAAKAMRMRKERYFVVKREALEAMAERLWPCQNGK